jgi:hypothetical protein
VGNTINAKPPTRIAALVVMLPTSSFHVWHCPPPVQFPGSIFPAWRGRLTHANVPLKYPIRMKTACYRNLINPINLLVAVIAVGILSGCGKNEADAPPVAAPAAAINATNPPVSATPANAAFEKLKGK